MTASPTLPIRRACSWASSTASTAPPARPIRAEPITAPTATSSIDGETRKTADDARTRSTHDLAGRIARSHAAPCLLSLAVSLGGCIMTAKHEDVTGAVPTDYRLRHPIAVKEAEHTLDIFVGARSRRADADDSALKCLPLRRPGTAKRPAASLSTCRPARRTRVRPRKPRARFARSWPAPASRRSAIRLRAIASDQSRPRWRRCA